jgi:tetratricopeptide (TPR) repeat protein
MISSDLIIRKFVLFIRIFFPIGLFLLFLLNSLPLIGRAYSNFGAIGLLKIICINKAPKCNPIHTQYSSIIGEKSQLSQFRDYYRSALSHLPDEKTLRIHQAELAFIAGDRVNALTWLSEVDGKTLSRSWLSYTNRYPLFIIEGWKQYLSGNWSQAIRNFRLGLFWAGELSLQSDENAYFDSLAMYHLSLKSNIHNNRLLAGIYKYYAGKLGQAEEIFTSFGDQSVSFPIDSRNMAIVYQYLGMIARNSGKEADAENGFRKSLYLDPENRFSYFNLLELLQSQNRKEEISKLKRKINFLGPTTLLGVTDGQRIIESRPAQVQDGWELVGYDIEKYLIADSHQIDIILWWKNTNHQPLTDRMVETGEYILQEQRVTNLLPNPGMEWGIDERGIPVGFDREFYTGDSSYLDIKTLVVDKNRTSVLISENSPEVRSLALTSREIKVNPEEYSLMAGWIYHEQGSPNIGRNCWGENFYPGGPYYIAYTQTPITTTKWYHAAELATPVPGKKPDYCEVLLINYESDKPAAWDQLLWVNIQIP